MSLKANTIYPIPQETMRVARAAYPNGNLYIQMRTVLGSVYTDEDFADLFPKEGQPAEARLPVSPDYGDAICREPV
jgi:transposase